MFLSTIKLQIMGYTLDIWEMFICSKTLRIAFYFFRFQILKTSFEKNIYRTVDYEERIFTSQVLQAFSSLLFLIIFVSSIRKKQSANRYQY